MSDKILGKFTFRSKVWLYPGKAGWHFMTIPIKLSQSIRTHFGHDARGWGSLPVQVTIGPASWQTSIFPETKLGTYLLPLKAAERKKAAIKAGTIRLCRLEILS
jgi:hypothetical protein